jgi:hypothetical protein
MSQTVTPIRDHRPEIATTAATEMLSARTRERGGRS